LKRAAARSMLVAVILLAVAVIVEAQQVKKVWHVGLFHVGLDHVPISLETFRAGLKTLGYEQGNNIYLHWRNFPMKRLPAKALKSSSRIG
jgi:hypothetical protein